MTRALYLVLGLGFTGLGIAGAFLPLLPTTVFLILAAGCFARSSPRLEAWILNHKQFGPLVRDWRAHGAIPRKAKVLACAGMAGGFVIFFLSAHPATWLALAVAGALGLCAAFVVSRPSGSRPGG
ncbi:MULTISPECIES: YbaN family protein [unclassified Phenylobacterium]|uniref:YbaN family protein n=1 Tax=unclassified Phenylobacterium TaxID=2640670 RepID=UPI0022B3C1B0|nr:YbaN family protein [Phenylobacterium sp. NIBR 498073]MBS0489642.1 YbaN family protein [Pseudomonadota bacterium]WGU38334.1 YbaN family protein [Phenylobacterium sp. NIBR 498073]